MKDIYNNRFSDIIYHPQIASKLDRYLKEFGFDAAPFLVQWYNDLSTIVKMDYPPNTGSV